MIKKVMGINQAWVITQQSKVIVFIMCIWISVENITVHSSAPDIT